MSNPPNSKVKEELKVVHSNLSDLDTYLMRNPQVFEDPEEDKKKIVAVMEMIERLVTKV